MTGLLLGAGRVARPRGTASITNVARPLSGPAELLGEPANQLERLLRPRQLGLEALGLLAALLVPLARILGHLRCVAAVRTGPVPTAVRSAETTRHFQVSRAGHALNP